MVSKIDLTPGVGIKQRISVSQYDVGRVIAVNLFDGYKPYAPPTSATAVIHGTKPSGLGFTVTGTINGTVASFTTTAEMTAESGYMDAEIQITAGGAIIGMANFIFYVEKSPHPTGTVDGTTADVVNAIEEAKAAAIEEIMAIRELVVTDDDAGNVTVSIS